MSDQTSNEKRVLKKYDAYLQSFTYVTLKHTISGSLVPCQGGSATSSAAKAKFVIEHAESCLAMLRGLCTDFDLTIKKLAAGIC